LVPAVIPAADALQTDQGMAVVIVSQHPTAKLVIQIREVDSLHLVVSTRRPCR
jgi:hypothetical protein